MHINVRNVVYKNIILIVGIFKFIAPLWAEFLREFLRSGTFPHWAELTSAFNMGEGPHSIGNVRLAAGKHLHLHLIQIHRRSSVVLAATISLWILNINIFFSLSLNSCCLMRCVHHQKEMYLWKIHRFRRINLEYYLAQQEHIVYHFVWLSKTGLTWIAKAYKRAKKVQCASLELKGRHLHLELSGLFYASWLQNVGVKEIYSSKLYQSNQSVLL